MSAPGTPKRRPNSLWQGASAFAMGVTGTLSRAFLTKLNDVEVIGLQPFLDLLESRRDPQKRDRGLITVSNHSMVLDDPMIWGVLPYKNLWEPWNLRWSLGAHDICFKSKTLSAFFSIGQVLPTHRIIHSQHGGLFQPTMTQAIRLLSAYPFTVKDSDNTVPLSPEQQYRKWLEDPFTTGALTYSTTGKDLFHAPSAYLSNQHSWVHVFPEGFVHQHPERTMRYFKWGVARLVLEAEPMPDVVPMFIDGTAAVMPEDRTWPRFIPRWGNKVRIAFGEKIDGEATFGDLRRRWKGLVRKAREEADVMAAIEAGTGEQDRDGEKKEKAKPFSIFSARTPEEEKKVSRKKVSVMALGELTDELKYGKEAEEIRIEVARRIRNEVLKIRKSLGYPDEDPKLGLAETWAKEPDKKRYRSEVDGSIIRDA